VGGRGGVAGELDGKVVAERRRCWPGGPFDGNDEARGVVRGDGSMPPRSQQHQGRALGRRGIGETGGGNCFGVSTEFWLNSNNGSGQR
jgi:hypothetical protein